MDIQSPAFSAFAVALLASILSWAYSKYALKEPAPEKTFAKTLASGFVAACAIVLYVKQYEPEVSLHADPFFGPMI